MKQIFIAAIMFLVAVSCDSQTAQSTTGDVAQSEVQSDSYSEACATSAELSQFPFAYVDIDLALANSNIYKLEGLPLQQRIEAAQRDWAQKERNFQSEVTRLNERYQNGLITTANAQLEQQGIEQRVQAYQVAMEQQAAQLDEESAVFSNRTQQLMRNAVTDVNADGKYKMIFNATALIDADTLLNISDQISAALDRLYAAETK
ncbi:MAG: OmpH family outer membrane protein [Rikenellaceae bacterium]